MKIDVVVETAAVLTVGLPPPAAIAVEVAPPGSIAITTGGPQGAQGPSGRIEDLPVDGNFYGGLDGQWARLGTAASAAVTDFATAAEGGLAQSAVQPGDLEAVAFSGSYLDLTNQPSIPAAQVPADWDAVSGVTRILNKPSIPTSPGGDFVGTSATQELTNKTLGAGTVEAVVVTSTVTINAASASWLQVELTDNAAATVSLSVGVSRSLWINPSTYTLTLPVGTEQVNFPDEGLPASTWSLITFTGRPGGSDGIAIFVMSLP